MTAAHADRTAVLVDQRFLSAVGAFKIAVILVPVNGSLKPEPLQHRTGKAHELGVFPSPGGNVSGEKAKQGDKDEHQAGPIERLKSGERKEQIEKEIKNDEGQVQLIVAVAAIHEAMERIANHRRASLRDGEGRRSRLPNCLK